MSILWKSGVVYRLVAYANELDLDNSVTELASELFGPDRIYVDIKKKVGKNIPDGYVIDLSGPAAVLYFVEVELSSHDLFRHMAVQILEFSFSFADDVWRLKAILHQALRNDAKSWAKCEAFVAAHSLNSVDHLLEGLIRRPFAAIVIIDAASERLETLFSERFNFAVEVLEVLRYENDQKQRLYQFEPLLADVANDLYGGNVGGQAVSKTIAIHDVDTIVVPAKEEGFNKVFLGQNEWYSVRIHGSMIPQIKYIAGYQVAPTSAITHIAPVKEIKPSSEEAGKYRLIFSEPARPIGPISYVSGGHTKQLQNLRYTTREPLLGAKTLDDVWANPEQPTADKNLESPL